jgi:hypothetical protein
MCVYESCKYGCVTKSEHHSKYARMRKNKVESSEYTEIIKSTKVNWDMVEELGFNKPIIRKRITRKPIIMNIRINYDEEIIV